MRASRSLSTALWIMRVEYVNGKIHTNGMENFWSLLKRGVKGTYVSVEPFHLFRYLDEQSFRFNNRRMTDGERFSMAVDGIAGKRLTFDQLTRKEAARTGDSSGVRPHAKAVESGLRSARP